MSPVIGVLALQGDVREHVAAVSSCGLRAVPVRRPAELDAVDALIIPGGESTTMSRLLSTFDLLEPLREADQATGMPAYGSCAGMILLAARDPGRAAGPAAARRPGRGGAAQRVRPAGRLVRGGPAVRPACRAARCGRCSSGRRGWSRWARTVRGAGDGAAADPDRHGRGRGGGPRGGGAAGGGAGDVVPPGDHGRPAGARAVLRDGAGGGRPRPERRGVDPRAVSTRVR